MKRGRFYPRWFPCELLDSFGLNNRSPDGRGEGGLGHFLHDATEDLFRQALFLFNSHRSQFHMDRAVIPNIRLLG